MRYTLSEELPHFSTVCYNFRHRFAPETTPSVVGTHGLAVHIYFSGCVYAFKFQVYPSNRSQLRFGEAFFVYAGAAPIVVLRQVQEYPMTKKKRGHPQGYYCKVCGEYKANEKFSSKGHAAHICKTYSQFSAAEQAEAMTINRLMELPVGRLNASDREWLENRLHDQRPEVASLAKEIYSLHFPCAERNVRKKRLTINTLSFELHTISFDEYGDDLPINQRFTADRISHITMTDFDAADAEQSIKLDGGAMSTLLRWIAHSLEIFMWPEDYVLDPESLSDCFWDVQDEEMDDDFPDEDTALPELDREASWRVLIKYTDHTTQEIISYQSHLSDRPEELYLALLEHFEPEMDKFGDDFTEDALPE